MSNPEDEEEVPIVPVPATPPPEPSPIVDFNADQDIDLRPQMPSWEELKANGGILYATWALKGMAYREYLQTNHWQTVRLRALRDADYRCFLCLRRVPLDVHHVDQQYKCLGEETPDDVVALCSGPDGCHKHKHEALAARAHAEGQKQFNRE